MIFVSRLFESIQHHHGFSNPHSLDDFLRPDAKRNELLICEREDEAEIAVCLEAALIERLQTTCPPEVLDWNTFPDLSIVIEELSHFNLFCERASRDRELSQLELETQAEVDKFSVALDWIEKRNEAELTDRIYNQIFGSDFRWRDNVNTEHLERYREAHRLAKGFCRKILNLAPTPENRLKLLREFFEGSLEKKQAFIHR